MNTRSFVLTFVTATLLSAITVHAEDYPPYRMTLTAPIDRWDEAIPLGNGQTGGLLWGKDNEIRLSLDRGDLWDLRVPPTYMEKDWSYQNLVKLARSKNSKELNRKYDTPFSRCAYPTKLPGARLVFTLSDQVKVKSFELDMKKAIGIAKLSDQSIQCFYSATQPVALMFIPGERPKFKLIASSDKTNTGKQEIASAMGVAKLGYPPAQHNQNKNSIWLTQKGALGFEYAVVVQAKQVKDGTLFVIAMTTNKTSDQPLKLAQQQIEQALTTGWDQLLNQHTNWWKKFWAKSSVKIPNAKIQQHYNLVQYFYGAASRRNSPPMPLQGLWTADTGRLPPWKGDYHHDLNTQLTYWAYLDAGRFDQGLSFIDFMWSLKPRHEKLAKEYYATKGHVVPGVMALNGDPMGGWAQYSFSPTNGAWVAQAFHKHWRYTMDERFLAERAYPYCTGIAEALVGLMKRDDKTGKLKLPLSSSPEVHNNSQRAWLTPNSNYDLSLICWIFGANAEMAKALNKTEDEKRWVHFLKQMDELAVEGEAGALRISSTESLTSSHRHFSHLMAIHPLGLINIEGSDRDRQIITASLKQMDKLGTKWWTGYSWSWMACMQARVGQGDVAMKYLSDYVNSFILRNGFHCNGEQTNKGLSNFRYRPFTLEGNFAASQAVHEMLLQSWGGRVRIFPALPSDWNNASFEKLHAEGGFVISAKHEAGQTTNVTITATVDQTLRLKNPFDNTGFKASLKYEKINDELLFDLKAGQSLKLMVR